MVNRFELRCPSRAENVGLCRVAAATFAANAGFGVGEIEEIKVAVSEAVSNVVVHAYPETEGLMSLRCEETEDGLTIAVSDEGIGIDPDAVGTLLAYAGRGDNVATIDGSGIGLYVARRVAERTREFAMMRTLGATRRQVLARSSSPSSPVAPPSSPKLRTTRKVRASAPTSSAAASR